MPFAPNQMAANPLSTSLIDLAAIAADLSVLLIAAFTMASRWAALCAAVRISPGSNGGTDPWCFDTQQCLQA